MRSHADLRQKLEEIFKLMLSTWCIETKALRLTSFENNGTDKTIVVQRKCGEFGFRIHGSKPVVVTAIEPGTPAESSGLEVGDILLTVNGLSVLDRSHSEVVQIAHAVSDILTLEVAQTTSALSGTKGEHVDPCIVYSGYLWKLKGYATGKTTDKWIRRWFCLTSDNILYYYKLESDKQPVGVIMLIDQKVEENVNECIISKSNQFVLHKEDSVPIYLAADTEKDKKNWVQFIRKYVNEYQDSDSFLETIRKNLILPPSAFTNPECSGYLTKLGNQWKSWSRRYCILKDAALYFYHDVNATSAFGVALLHGYKVQQSTSKKPAFEMIPPNPSKKHYYFHAEADTDRKRWISALEYSIDRWLRIS